MREKVLDYTAIHKSKGTCMNLTNESPEPAVKQQPAFMVANVIQSI